MFVMGVGAHIFLIQVTGTGVQYIKEQKINSNAQNQLHLNRLLRKLRKSSIGKLSSSNSI